MYGIMHPDSRSVPPLPPLRARIPTLGAPSARAPAVEEMHYNQRPRGAVYASPRVSSPRAGGRKGVDASYRGSSSQPSNSDENMNPLQSFDSEDPKVVVTLRARMRDLMRSGVALRHDVDEMQRREHELRTRAHVAWAEQRERVEATRQECGAALTDLRQELRSRFEMAERKQLDLLREDRYQLKCLNPNLD